MSDHVFMLSAFNQRMHSVLLYITNAVLGIRNATVNKIDNNSH